MLLSGAFMKKLAVSSVTFESEQQTGHTLREIRDKLQCTMDLQIQIGFVQAASMKLCTVHLLSDSLPQC